VVLAAVVAVGGYAASLVGDPPVTPPDCGNTALVLGSKTLENTLAIRYTFTGPKDAAYVVAVDAASVQVEGDDVTVTRRTDAVDAETFPYSKVFRPSECRANGTLSVDPTVGVRHVTLFVVDDEGRGRVADDETVEVLEP
jgi:hypothetical protein